MSVPRRLRNRTAGTGSKVTSNGSAAIAFAPEHYRTEAETLIAKGWPVLQSAMQRFAGENGGWPEGPGYMGYGTLYLIRFMNNLQTAVGTGALGLLALLAMFGLGMRAMVRTVTSERSPIARRMVALSAGGSLLAIMVYGLVQEVTYIHALRLMLCCAVGLLAAGVPADERGT